MQMVDGVTVHPYRKFPPETAAAEYQKLRELALGAGCQTRLGDGQYLCNKDEAGSCPAGWLREPAAGFFFFLPAATAGSAGQDSR